MMQASSELLHTTTMSAAVIALAPLLAFGFSATLPGRIRRLPPRVQIAVPGALATPYLLAELPLGWFRWQWFALYLLLPPLIAALLALVARLDPEGRGHWIEFLVLLGLGLAVDLRWLERAWPHDLSFINKLLLLDAGLYGFMGVRALSGVGYDLKLRASDWKIGLREWMLYAPIAIMLGFALGFLHWHSPVDRPWMI